MFNLIKIHIKQKKLATVSLIVSIAVSVAAFLVLCLLFGGASKGIELNKERSGAQIMCVPTEAQSEVENEAILFTGAALNSYMDASLADSMRDIEGVEQVTIQFFGQTLSGGCCSSPNDTRIIGVDMSTDFIIKPFLEEKGINGLADDEILIGSKVLGFESGEGTVLSYPVKVKGVLAETGSYLDNSILMSLKRVREISASESSYSYLWEKYGQPENLASAILIKTNFDRNDVLAGRIKRYVKGDYATIVQNEVVEKSQQTLNSLYAVMLFAGVALAIASILQLISRYANSVWERRAELALFRALGATIRDVKALIRGEAFLLTGLGSIIGLALGGILYAVFLPYLQSSSAFPFSALVPVSVAGICVALVAIFLLVTLISIVPPMRQASKIDPASAMSQVDIG
jgi:putative ABC transport system permease protein